MKNFKTAETQYTESGITDYGSSRPLVDGQTVSPDGDPSRRNSGQSTMTDEDNRTVVEHVIHVMDSKGNKKKILPVVGWLVCVKGPDMGKDFTLRVGYNNIGRGPDLQVVLSDQAVNREPVGWIIYVQRSRKFCIAAEKPQGAGGVLMYLNGKEHLAGQYSDLNPYDRIEMGSTALVFIPFCGTGFDWEAELIPQAPAK